MKLRFYVDGALLSVTAATTVPDIGEKVAIDGNVRIVDDRRWDFWSSDADPVVNLYLSSARGPKPTLKKAKRDL